MRKILFFLLFIQFSCYELKRDCKSFHLGEFKFSQIIGGEMKTSYFKRDSLYEIEIFENKLIPLELIGLVIVSVFLLN